jgi:hypothetical protein
MQKATEREARLTIAELSRQLRISRQSIYVAIRRGEIPGRRDPNGGYEIPADARALILARAYTGWPAKDRPSAAEVAVLKVISVTEAGRAMNPPLGSAAAYVAVRAGRIPNVRIGGRYLVPSDAPGRVKARLAACALEQWRSSR